PPGTVTAAILSGFTAAARIPSQLLMVCEDESACDKSGTGSVRKTELKDPWLKMFPVTVMDVLSPAWRFSPEKLQSVMSPPTLICVGLSVTRERSFMLPLMLSITKFGLFNSGGVEAWSLVPNVSEPTKRVCPLSDMLNVALGVSP